MQPELEKKQLICDSKHSSSLCFASSFFFLCALQFSHSTGAISQTSMWSCCYMEHIANLESIFLKEFKAENARHWSKRTNFFMFIFQLLQEFNCTSFVCIRTRSLSFTRKGVYYLNIKAIRCNMSGKFTPLTFPFATELFFVTKSS